jgi:hypothetical protein
MAKTIKNTTDNEIPKEEKKLKKSTFLTSTKKQGKYSSKNCKKTKKIDHKLAVLHASNSFKDINSASANSKSAGKNGMGKDNKELEKKIKSDVGDDTDLDNRELDEPSHLFTPPHSDLVKCAFQSQQK